MLTTNSPICTDDCLAALLSAPSLRVLELCPKSFTLSSEQLRLAGMLNLRELRLESHTFKQQPLNRVGQSHIDNEGVKALVDSICTRCLFQRGQPSTRQEPHGHRTFAVVCACSLGPIYTMKSSCASTSEASCGVQASSRSSSRSVGQQRSHTTQSARC